MIKTRYELSEEDEGRIENNFTYHSPFGDQPERYEDMRSEFRNLAKLICRYCPVSRERSLALTNLEQAAFCANAAIARNEKEDKEDGN